MVKSRHLLALLVAYFIGTNSLTVQAASLLFYSNFGSGVSLGTAYDFLGNRAWQDIQGTDSETGYSWPVAGVGATFSGIQLVTIDSTLTDGELSTYALNEIRRMPGPKVKQVNALFMDVLKKGPVGTWDAQNPLMIQRPWTIGDLTNFYISYWYKLPAETADQLDPDPIKAVFGANRVLQFEFKTGGHDNSWTGDYRTSIGIEKDSSGKLYWSSHADNQANSGFEKVEAWHEENHTVPVPIDTWYKVEIYIRRSTTDLTTDGYAWAAINGQTILNYSGPNKGVELLPITRIMVNNLYTGGHGPLSGNLTGLEIWKGFPCGWKVSCYNFDTVAPVAPVLSLPSVSSGTSSATVSLTWGASTDNVGTAGYYIYRSGKRIGVTTGVSFIDSIPGAATGTKYYYRVEAFDTAGNLSDRSNFYTVTW